MLLPDNAVVTVLGVVVTLLVAGGFVGSGLVWQLLRQNGRMLVRLEAVERRLADWPVEPEAADGLAIGEPAPHFELTDLSGERRTLSQLRGRPVLLVFFDPSCRFCVEMAPALARVPADGAGGGPVPLVVAAGDPEKTRELVARERIRCAVLLQEGTDVSALYRTDATPTAYLVDRDGRVASELARGAAAVLALASPSPPASADAAAARSRNGAGGEAPGLGTRPLATSRLRRVGLEAGTPAPDFVLPRLDGGELSLRSHRGSRVLLVFSDPECEPCDELAPRLERLHRRTPGVHVLMVSRRGLEANRSKAATLGLTFPVAVQRHWEVSRLYGMFATPIAYLVDERGVVVTNVAVGVEPVLALLSHGAGRSPGEVGPELRA